MSVNNHRKCAKCGKTRAEDMSVTYHTFPKPGKSNITKALAWAKYCWPNENWTTESLEALHITSKVLCGRHFDSSQFYDNNRQKLSRFAVPDSAEVNTLLNNRENVFNEDVEQTKVTEKLVSRVPFSQLGNIQGEASTSKASTSGVLSTQGTSVDVPKSSALSKDNQINKLSSATKTLPSQIDTQLTKSISKKRNVLSAIGISKLSEMTPREMKLYKICRQKLKEIIRLRKSLKHKKAHVSSICEDENIQKLCNMNVSNSFITLLQSQLKNCPKKAKGRRYSLEDKLMSLVVYKKSPACYRLLRRMFALPCQSSLNKLLIRVPLKPGINDHIFKSLRNMAKGQREEDNLCILSFDEMALRKHLNYDPKMDEIQGFQDHGNHGRNNEIAHKVLVFMLAGVRKQWKQPIAFYFSHSLTADRLTVILKEVLTKCLENKMNVVATVCDLSTVNIKVLKTLGATTSEPYFRINEKEIVAILDPPHLLKCTRNLFMKHDVECTTIQCNDTTIKGTAKWRHIVSFFELDKNNPNFVFAPALTESHLNPNLHQQMRVKLAAQIFSHAVASGLYGRIALTMMHKELQRVKSE